MRLCDDEREVLPRWRRRGREEAGDEERCSDFQSSERESNHGSILTDESGGRWGCWCLMFVYVRCEDEELSMSVGMDLSLGMSTVLSLSQ